MSMKIRGLKALERRLEDRIGVARTGRISDAALKAAGKEFVKTLKRDFLSFKDTGASRDEMTLTEPYTENGVRVITVKWKGPKNRYRIIHLNEFGTVKNPNPDGKGVIAATLKSSEKIYRKAIADAYRAALK
ncbi:conserved hypothetical protein [Bacillus sp. 349Y]|nr:conserved hypothetical protein [Bacillus sp. 349Y]